MLYEVHVVARGVTSGDESYLNRLTAVLEGIGGEGVAVVHYPEDNEIGIVFDIEEEALGRLLESEGDRAAA